MNTNRSTAFRNRSLVLGCIGTAAAFASPALAQGTTATGNVEQAETRLEGMTITDDAVSDGYRAEAQRSPKATAPLIDTPRIVNVVTEDVIEHTASFTLEDALRTVPGITLGAGEGGTAAADIPLIRGVDATGDVFVDGLRDIGSQTRETFALEAIEVAKGPSSTFGGRGTAAGAINLVSKIAKEGDAIEAQATVGTDEFYRATADVNAQVADKLAFRVVGMWQDSEVAGRDAVFNDRWGVMPSVTWGAGTPITASLAYYHYETDSMPDYGIPTTSRGQLPDERREPADVDFDNFYGLLARDFQETSVDSGSFLFNGYLGGGVTLSHGTRFSRARNDYIVTNPDDSAGNVANGQVWRATKSRNSLSDSIASNTNLAAVFDTGGIGHSLSAGFEYSYADSANRNYSVDTGDRNCPEISFETYNCTDLANPDPSDPWTGTITRSTTPANATAEDYSVYLFDTVTLLPSLLVNGGVRWTDFSATASGCGRGGCYDAATDGDFFSYQAGVIFKPTSSTSLYASYADSKTPPGATVGEGAENLNGNNQSYRPQGFENWEVGAKAELFGGDMLLSGALYRVKRNNIVQLDDLDNVVETFGSARLQGVEVSASGRIGALTLLAGYTLVDSELRDEADANFGNALPNTPRHNFALTGNYQVTPRFAVGGGAYGASKRYADGANLISADGYVRLDANAEFLFTDHLGLRLNVQNLTDERYAVKLRNPHFAIPAAGRQALATLSVRY
ncbi:TonB-dependent siderophore receptor [Croceicoccus sp. YJ47]|uniref:TonB-dependent receptor n=1 Tax=Croceicoccus sp. YJ47 TaxID=2798724 RepID=UPI00192215AA|nr:TonB-dependent siderophore receptor [Croceicoccus sp. YJ47]QQN73387.1 TonB-dependent siderophore receptor [Croceicoccus sp. YJ47]